MNKQTFIIDAADLRAILDYLHDSEADHYDPEDANPHVYRHVLAIEQQLNAVTPSLAQGASS